MMQNEYTYYNASQLHENDATESSENLHLRWCEFAETV